MLPIILALVQQLNRLYLSSQHRVILKYIGE